MSILVGILSRQRDRAPDDALCEKLKRAVSRNPIDEVVLFRDRNVGLFKVDVGAYGEPAFHADKSGSVSMLAGEPLLDLEDDAASRGRSQDLELLHGAFERKQWAVLARTTGAYCAVHYDPHSGTVSLVADRLSLRPIYYWIGPEYVIFSSALRVLEGLAEVPKTMDLVAATEIATLYCPVGNRTPYSEIKGLKAGEILQFTQDRVRAVPYWRWDSIKLSTLPAKEKLEETYGRFRKAVKRRLRKDKVVIAALSGGLDSRCVVAALRSEQAQVHSLNFYRDLQSQDRVFAAEYAKQVGSVHEAVLLPEWGAPGSFEQRVTDAWRASPAARDAKPEHPQMLWMGDGGSLGLGHIYIEREVVDALRARRLNEAISAYRPRLVSRLLKDDSSGAIAELVAADIRAELEDLRFEDPARAIYMFLMLYEQRYDVMQHLEDVDIHRLECHWPFFDSDFLASVVSAPMDWCLGHGFYTDWLALFQPAVTSVPWQTYPGHRKCPLPVPEGLAYQWDKAPPSSEVDGKRRELLRVADKVLGSDNFPDLILKKRILSVAKWMHKAGLRDGETAIKAAEIYHRYWIACGGKFVVQPSVSSNHD